MPTTGNVAAAEQVLEKAGFTKGSNGFFVQVKEGDTGYTGSDFSGCFVFTGATSPFLAA